MRSTGNEGSGYWYGPDGQLDYGAAVLKSLRDYRTAETAVRRSTRDSMGMGETDILALRYLLRVQASGKTVVPKDISQFLGITSASTTSLIDRLVASGHVRREAHPTDRRSVVVVPTVESDKEVRVTLGAMHRQMMSVAEGLTAEEARVVVKFLERMTEALQQAQHDEK
ncbi:MULTISPECIES: MarR family winged helix-turn-helix transcriptional regulator [Micrococcaceae]|jgi:DNA-binding MarR family transcriptional regulator|uniref:MarR family winged helix-turn-helix transcriptional regulator n=1 Tax=Micrococcaceae TaxID=1268 RepID=UPI002AA95907|nr:MULTISPECIES: MarR family transcriptional regulator [Pseudarthrobacter]MEA3552262.1 MarR family transcriptional regulator [Pseudarthrobacter sp. C1]WPU09318.1 MarR family transcriptional regulator [Pseudarthrobacter oxydans]HET7780799.1 MarR family transcriptional regulator [Arthrobacter sp.]